MEIFEINLLLMLCFVYAYFLFSINNGNLDREFSD